MLSVLLPANVLFMQDVIDQIVNFKPIDKETLQENILDPVFGSKDDQDTTTDSDSGPNLLASSVILVAVLILIGLLITLIVICRRRCKIKCCTCWTKLVAAVQAKLMFNALLRALI